MNTNRRQRINVCEFMFTQPHVPSSVIAMHVIIALRFPCYVGLPPLPKVVEVYSDSGWNGGTGFKSTSSAMRVLNGLIVHSTSRSQKAISLSFTEAEWYAGSAATCDSLFLRRIVQFLTDDVQCVVFHVDNSAGRNVAAKLGVGRLRRISGRMTWMQQLLRAKRLGSDRSQHSTT